MDFPKAIELLEKSEHLALVIPDMPDLGILASAEALLRILEERGKHVGLLSKISPDPFKQRELFTKVAKAEPLLREFIVSVNTAQSPVSELRYEKQEEQINIIFAPQSSPLLKDAVSFREGKVQCDGALLLGISSLESLPNIQDVGPEFFTETPLLTIDLSPQHTNYGEVNLVEPEKSSLTEIVYELISTWQNGPLEKSLADLLLLGLLAETGAFQSPRTNADTLLVASELLRLGASHTAALSHLSESRPLGLMQLFGRASVRSKMDGAGGTLWSFITSEDFEKTGRTVADAPRVLEHLEKTFPPHTATSLLWQDPQEEEVQVLLGGKRDWLEELRNQEGGSFQSPYLKLHARFSSFREAEEYLTSLLDKVR